MFSPSTWHTIQPSSPLSLLPPLFQVSLPHARNIHGHSTREWEVGIVVSPPASLHKNPNPPTNQPTNPREKKKKDLQTQNNNNNTSVSKPPPPLGPPPRERLAPGLRALPAEEPVPPLLHQPRRPRHGRPRAPPRLRQRQPRVRRHGLPRHHVRRRRRRCCCCCCRWE